MAATIPLYVRITPEQQAKLKRIAKAKDRSEAWVIRNMIDHDRPGGREVTYSVHDEPDFERTYDEDEIIPVRKGDLRAVLDVATMSMDFGSGFLDNEQVEALRKMAEIIGVDPLLATPPNFVCQYGQSHQWVKNSGTPFMPRPWYCALCHHTSDTDPTA